MFINENINNTLSMDDTGLDWSIDWGFKSIAGAGRIEIAVLFWNDVNGEQLNKNSRNLYIITGAVAKDIGFSLNMLEEFFYFFHPYLLKP
jgi:hypothetical protein